MSSHESKREGNNKESCKVITTNYDRISNLPNDVTHQILECLPLEQAAKTSILSRHWRYKWASMSQLILDDSFYKRMFHDDLSQGYDHETSLEYSNVINKILLHHVGPIRKFVLHSPGWFSDRTHMASQWIHHVCANKDVKELTLEGQIRSGKRNNIPTCLFSTTCVGLTHLTLKLYNILFIPPTFRGFPCLRSLHLSVSFVINLDTDLENLISKCPLLETLCMEIYDDDLELVIRAPKLQDLRFRGCVKGLSLEGTTVIKRLDLTMVCSYFQKSKNLDDFFGCLPNVEKLMLSMAYYKFNSPKKFATKMEQLRIVELVQLRFYQSHSIYFLLSLVKNSPNLEQLYVRAMEPEVGEDLDEVQIDGLCDLKRLKKIQLVDISGVINELRFIKFILASSPTMKEMIIKVSYIVATNGEKYRLAKQVMQYSRASPLAEIFCKG